jgi:hypothetical protein
MISALVIALAIGAQGAASTEPAAAPAPAEAQAQAPLKPGQERVKVRCRLERPTGTRFAERKCRRLDDLARMEEDAREAITNINRLPTLPPASN